MSTGPHPVCELWSSRRPYPRVLFSSRRRQRPRPPSSWCYRSPNFLPTDFQDRRDLRRRSGALALRGTMHNLRDPVASRRKSDPERLPCSRSAGSTSTMFDFSEALCSGKKSASQRMPISPLAVSVLSGAGTHLKSPMTSSPSARGARGNRFRTQGRQQGVPTKLPSPLLCRRRVSARTARLCHHRRDSAAMIRLATGANPALSQAQNNTKRAVCHLRA